LSTALFTWKGRPDWVEDRGETSPLPWLIRGAHAIEGPGKRAPPGWPPPKVPKDAWGVFLERLEQGEEDLNRAVEMHPEDPTPFGRLVIAAMGRNLGVPE